MKGFIKDEIPSRWDENRMTHDELLIEINRRLDVSYYNGDPQSMQALRAVVKLITKEDTIPLDDYHFGYMAACKDIYEAIEKELG